MRKAPNQTEPKPKQAQIKVSPIRLQQAMMTTDPDENRSKKQSEFSEIT